MCYWRRDSTAGRRRELKKNSDFYVFSLFEANTLSTGNYDLSLESVNKNTSINGLKVFRKYPKEDFGNVAFFLFTYKLLLEVTAGGWRRRSKMARIYLDKFLEKMLKIPSEQIC